MSEDKGDKWEMPKPVFQSTSGSLPKSLEDTIHESTFPSAETVKINKETVEIDADTLEIGEDTMEMIAEDEDILSLHDSPPDKQPVEEEDLDTTLTMDAAEPEAEPEPQIAAETAPEPAPAAETSEEVATAAADPPQPAVATPELPAAKTEVKKSGAGSFLLVVIVLVLLAGVIVAGVLYYMSRR